MAGDILSMVVAIVVLAVIWAQLTHPRGLRRGYLAPPIASGHTSVLLVHPPNGLFVCARPLKTARNGLCFAIEAIC